MELLLRLLSLLQRVILTCLTPVYWLLTKLETAVPLQPIRNPILTLSATQLAAQIRTQQLKCEDVIEAYNFRCRRVDIKLNAVVEDRYNASLKEAEKVDQLIASKTKSVKELEEEYPLLGVPLTVNECCQVKGMSLSVGCRFRVGQRADKDGAAVALLRRAGAIPIAVTNQPELCTASETYNLVSGLTRNPYNFHHSVGGTAGGEACLIGAAGSVVGVGSDFVGSLRCPSMFTGIFGHRPTPNVVSVEGHYPGESADLLTIGPMTRYAEDLPLMLRVMAGENADQLALHQQVNLPDVNVYYMTEIEQSFGLPSVDKEIKMAIIKAVDYLRTNCSCSIKKVSFKEMSDCAEISRTVLYNTRHLPNIFKELDPRSVKESPNLLMEIAKSCIRFSSYSLAALHYTLVKLARGLIPAEKTQKYLLQLGSLKKHLSEILAEDGVLILPTHPSGAHYHYQFLLRMLDTSYCDIITSLGLPATNVPMGLNGQGLPIGLQVVASPYQDRLCLAVAQELERGFGGWVQPPCLQTPT